MFFSKCVRRTAGEVRLGNTTSGAKGRAQGCGQTTCLGSGDYAESIATTFMRLQWFPKAQQFDSRHDRCGAARNLSSEMRALSKSAAIGRRCNFLAVRFWGAATPRL